LTLPDVPSPASFPVLLPHRSHSQPHTLPIRRGLETSCVPSRGNGLSRSHCSAEGQGRTDWHQAALWCTMQKPAWGLRGLSTRRRDTRRVSAPRRRRGLLPRQAPRLSRERPCTGRRTGTGARQKRCAIAPGARRGSRTAGIQTRAKIPSLAQLHQSGYRSPLVDATMAQCVAMERARLAREATPVGAARSHATAAPAPPSTSPASSRSTRRSAHDHV
jgi:hypothetical protein